MSDLHPVWRVLRAGLAAVALLASGPAPASPPTDLPPACSSACVTPYGERLGASPDGVAAFSNCSAQCVLARPHAVAGTFTGIEWQCVELARRWLILNRGLTYGEVDVAADIWDRVQHFTRVADGAAVPLDNLLNGDSTPPRPGDLLIYAESYLGTGHVAVVTAVDPQTGWVRVAEQNFRNEPWPGDYAREVELLEHRGRYWVLDPHLIGWKRVREVGG